MAETSVKNRYNETALAERIVFLYDESGMVGMEYTTGGVSTMYYFQRNLQGDVIGITNVSGTIVAQYSYDAWGTCTILSDITNGIATVNPFRYRGYYFDTETNLYYLQSRYYDPQTGRFINADSVEWVGTNGRILETNLFAYCGNDCIKKSDEAGYGGVDMLLEALGSCVDVVAKIIDMIGNACVYPHSVKLCEGLWDESSIYAVYDYLSEEKPTVETLRTCGFLPAHQYFFKDFNRKIHDYCGWTYTLTMYTSLFAERASFSESEKMTDFGEVARFHDLLNPKNYLSAPDRDFMAIYDIFKVFWHDKLRLMLAHRPIDNLLSEHITNPQLLTPQEADIAYREWSNRLFQSRNTS